MSGRCLEQPGEPEGSTFKDRVKAKAYPVHEAGGIVWTYMGPREVPPRMKIVGMPTRSLIVMSLNAWGLHRAAPARSQRPRGRWCTAGPARRRR